MSELLARGRQRERERLQEVVGGTGPKEELLCVVESLRGSGGGMWRLLVLLSLPLSRGESRFWMLWCVVGRSVGGWVGRGGVMT